MSRIQCLMPLYTFLEILTMNSNLPKATQIFKCFPSFKCQSRFFNHFRRKSYFLNLKILNFSIVDDFDV